LASCYLTLKEYDKSEENYHKAIKIFVDRGEAKHDRVAAAYTYIGVIKT